MKKKFTSPGIHGRLLKVRKIKTLKQREFAEILGVTPSYICDIEKKRIAPSMDLLYKTSKLLNVSLDWLLTGIGDMDRKSGPYEMQQKMSWMNKFKIPVRPVPILNTVPAGFPETPIDDHIVDWVLIPVELRDTKAFALIISGKSMYPKFNDNDIVIISPRAKVSTGKIGAFRLNGDVTIKRLLKKDGKTYLIAENPDYPPLTLKEDDELIAIGRAVYQIKKIE